MQVLVSEGHDALWVQRAMPGATDTTLLRRAESDERILLTLDKDFGELAFHAQLPVSCGIILLRVTASSPKAMTDVVLQALQSLNPWEGHFSLIENHRVPVRPLRP